MDFSNQAKRRQTSSRGALVAISEKGTDAQMPPVPVNTSPKPKPTASARYGRPVPTVLSLLVKLTLGPELAPTGTMQRRPEHEHREDLRDLADAHDRRDPIGGDADAARERATAADWLGRDSCRGMAVAIRSFPAEVRAWRRRGGGLARPWMTPVQAVSPEFTLNPKPGWSTDP